MSSYLQSLSSNLTSGGSVLNNVPTTKKYFRRGRNDPLKAPEKEEKAERPEEDKKFRRRGRNQAVLLKAAEERSRALSKNESGDKEPFRAQVVNSDSVSFVGKSRIQRQ